jgi:hypothetical protein
MMSQTVERRYRPRGVGDRRRMRRRGQGGDAGPAVVASVVCERFAARLAAAAPTVTY